VLARLLLAENRLPTLFTVPVVRQQSVFSLYRRGETGFPTLGIQNGQIDLESVLEAPYGYGFDLDIASFTPLDEWSVDSLEIE